MMLRRRYRYALRDRFDTDAAAPLTSPRTAEPGPGTLTVVDTNSKLSVSGGKLAFATGGSSSGDPGVYATGVARVVGRAVLATLNVTSATSGLEFGFDSVAGSSITDCLRFEGAGVVKCRVNSAATSAIAAYSLSADYQVAIVLRTTGMFALIKGGAFTSWTLLWVSTESSFATGLPAMYAGGATAAFTGDDFRVTDLGGAWASDYGIATTRLAGSRADADTFTHTADFIGEWTIDTLPASGTIDYEFRRQDASNLWKVSVTSAGAINLYERVAGSDTSRASGTGVTAGNRMVVIASGSSISMYAANAQKGSTYASASNFATATSGRLALPSGAASGIATYPRTVSLPSGV